MSILDTLVSVYARTFAVCRRLAQVSVLWFFLALVGEILRRSGESAAGGAVSVLALMGMLLHLIAALSGWYFAHCSLYKPNEKITLLPTLTQFKFIGVQALNVILLGAVSGVIVGVLGLFWIHDIGSRTQEEIQNGAQSASFFGMPFVLLIFGRLLLMAPSMVRNQKQSFRVSWKATKGRTLRLFMLQLGCLIPTGGAESIAALLRAFDAPLIVPAVISVIGVFLSLWLYNRLAEDEYARFTGRAGSCASSRSPCSPSQSRR